VTVNDFNKYFGLAAEDRADRVDRYEKRPTDLLSNNLKRIHLFWLDMVEHYQDI
jgi:hypothetical protein